MRQQLHRLLFKWNFTSGVLPYLLKTKENPDGVDKQVFDQMKDAINNDRIAFLADFGK